MEVPAGEVVGVEVLTGTITGVGSVTFTVREAVPVRPEVAEVTLYTTVCVPIDDVSTTI